MKNNFLITVLLVVLFTGAGFFAGLKYQQSKTPAFSFGQNMRGQFGNNSNTNSNRNRMGGNISGEILSVDDKSVTIKTNDGGSKIVLISDKTSINKATTTTISDLKVGEKVITFGSVNTDGSVTAQNIQLNPINAPSEKRAN